MFFNRQVKAEDVAEELIDTNALSDSELKAKLAEDRPGETIVEETVELESEDDTTSVDSEKGESEDQSDEYSKLSKEELVARLKSKSKEVDTQRSFIEKRRSEISELKKQVAEKKATFTEDKLDPEFKEKFFDDPEKGINQILEKKASSEERQRLLNDEYRLETEEFALTVDPEFYGKLDDMVEIIVNEFKVPKDRAMAFKSDPFSERREILVDLIRRVENKNLKSEMAKLKSKPKEMLDKIESLTRRKPLKPSSDKRNIDLDKIQIASLKDDELANYLKERKDT